MRRREAVAELAARRVSVRTIAKKLADRGIVNPRSKQPWSHGIIHADLQRLEAEWREKAELATEDLKSRELAELDEISRACWQDYVRSKKGKAFVLRTLVRVQERRAKLLGLDSPTKTSGSLHHTFPEGTGYVAVMLPDNGRPPQEDPAEKAAAGEK